jgi:Cytochrome P460
LAKAYNLKIGGLNLPAKALAVFCLFVCSLVALMSFGFGSKTASVAAASHPGSTPAYTPTYTKDGDLAPPLEYREWIYLTSGLDMNYTARANADMSMFDNVFVNPEAYRAFVATGMWPDKTVMVLESRGAASKGSINKAGHFQSGSVMGLELHVKDESRFPGKWAFFDVASESKSTLLPQTATCYTCHAEHAAVDTTFVQFYPTLLPVARQKGTLSANYLKDVAAEPKE